MDTVRNNDMNKKVWGNVNLPKQIIKRIRKVIPWVGYSSVAEYVRDAVRKELRRHELYVDNQEEKLRRDKEEDAS